MRAVIAVLILACAAPAFAETRFFAAIEDLPVADGLVEEGVGFSFEDASGRMVSASARGAVAPAAVGGFYLDTLPALGWSYSPGGEDLVFLRGRERLILFIAAEDAGSTLEVRLFTRPASMNAD